MSLGGWCCAGGVCWWYQSIFRSYGGEEEGAVGRTAVPLQVRLCPDHPQEGSTSLPLIARLGFCDGSFGVSLNALTVQLARLVGKQGLLHCHHSAFCNGKMGFSVFISSPISSFSVCVCVCVHACVHARMCVCVCVCVNTDGINFNRELFWYYQFHIH